MVHGVTAPAAGTVVNLGNIRIGYFFGTGVKLQRRRNHRERQPDRLSPSSVAGATDGFGIVDAGGSLANYGVVTTGDRADPANRGVLTASHGTNHGTIVGGATAGQRRGRTPAPAVLATPAAPG